MEAETKHNLAELDHGPGTFNHERSRIRPRRFIFFRRQRRRRRRETFPRRIRYPRVERAERLT